MTAPVLQFKRGLLANLPGLRAGEPGFTTDSYDLYVGIDSTTTNNKFFGSHRYWTRGTATTGSGVNFVEGTNNGTQYITLKSPDSLAGIVTYTLPGIQGSTSSVLTNDGNGTLSWASGSNNATFSGITTFTDTTDNTLGNENTGSIHLDGGMGIAKNLTVKQNLHVGGYSEFVGVVTFKGGTINLGDSNTDDIVVAGEFKSSLNPTDDASYDIGDGANSKRWRNASFSGVGTFATGAVIDVVQIGISGSSEIDTSSGNLTLDSATGTTVIDDNLSVTGFTTLTSGLKATGNVTIGSNPGGIETLEILSGGVIFYSSNITGTISTATRATTLDTVTASDANSTHYLTFVNSHNTTAATETVYTDDGIYYNPGTNTFTTQHALFTGDVTVQGTIVGIASTARTVNTTGTSNDATYFVTFTDTSGGQVGETLRVGTALTLNASTGNVKSAGDLIVGSGYLSSGNGTRSMYMFDTSGDVSFQGKVIADNFRSSSNASNTLTFADLDATFARNLYVTGITTVNNNLIVTGDVRINGNDIQASDGNTNISLTSNTLTTFAGDIKVSGNDIQASDGTATISMSGANVTVAGDLTVGGNDIKSSDGTTALSFSNSTGAVTAANDLTINGNLYVAGNTTQVNTAALSVEDRTIDLGIVNGATPASATTWDLGVLFNYHSGGSAKKSAVIWEHGDSRFKFASVLSTDADGTNNDSPQLSVTTFSPIEISALWINDCAGQHQVISCSGSTRYLNDITIDAGSF
jgi:hypothetical protein